MKLSKVDKKGNPTSIPEDMGLIVRRLGISAPRNVASTLEYLLSEGYVVVEPSTLPQPPDELRGRCRIELDIPKREKDGSYTRTYKFIELEPSSVEFLDAKNRAKRDKSLKGIVDPINAIRWAAMTPEKQAEWIDYRQALLDVTKQDGWPANIDWPLIPV